MPLMIRLENYIVRAILLKSSVRIAKESINIYGYIVELVDNKGQTQQIPETVYSINKLDNEFFDANFLSVNKMFDRGSIGNFILILGTNSWNDDNPLPYKIINDEGKYFLDDIFNSVVKYLKKEHNIIVRDDNKCIAFFVIFQLLSNIFHNQRFNMLALGVSGSGKTFWGNTLPSLFTSAHSEVDGVNVSKNVFLGGTSNVKSINGTDVIAKGIIGTRDFIIADEASNAINKFQNGDINNIFYYLKLSSSDKQYISTRGTMNYDNRASVYLTGNLEHLAWTKIYKKKVIKKYKEINRYGL